ncbi:MAG: ATP-binding protein [Acidimicrobiales bacterium]
MRTSRHFAHDPRSVTQARRFITAALAGTPPDTRDAAEMMVSELATNAVLHTESEFTVLVVHSGDRVRVEVSDGGTGWPAMRPLDPASMSGRGLHTVELLSEQWGVEPATGAPGKTVWFSLTRHTRRARRVAPASRLSRVADEAGV